jgi:hypothetical protein
MMNFELDDSGLTFLDSLTSLDSDKVNYRVVSRIKTVSRESPVFLIFTSNGTFSKK